MSIPTERGATFGEPNFFVSEFNWSRGLGWYESLFDGAGGAAAIGQCSPCYTMTPLSAAFPAHFDRSQMVVVASEVLRDSPREALSAMFDHIAVDPAAVDLDERHRHHCSLDKPVPRLHDLHWLPRSRP